MLWATIVKKIPNPFPWYPRDFWYWPDNDEKLLQVIDWVHDLDQVLPLIPNKRVCVQAGGACGVWPVYLSKFFDEIYTFEPQNENHRCLLENVFAVDDDDKIICHYSALGEFYGHCEMLLDKSERNNAGAFYMAQGVITDIQTIDSIVMSYDEEDVDFICLDVEGFEEKALKGAAKTIEHCKPVIMIEEKPLPHLKEGEHLKARQYLESIGYKEVLKVHRDVVFAV